MPPFGRREIGPHRLCRARSPPCLTRATPRLSLADLKFLSAPTRFGSFHDLLQAQTASNPTATGGGGLLPDGPASFDGRPAALSRPYSLSTDLLRCIPHDVRGGAASLNEPSSQDRQLSPPDIVAGNASAFETPLPSGTTSPLSGVFSSSFCGKDVSAQMRAELMRAVASAAAEPGEPRLPAKFLSARRSPHSWRSQQSSPYPAASPYGSCENLAAFGAAMEAMEATGAGAANATPRLAGSSAGPSPALRPASSGSAMSRVATLPLLHTLGGALSASATPAPEASPLTEERPRSAPSGAFCAQCTLGDASSAPSPMHELHLLEPASPPLAPAAAAPAMPQITVLPGASAALPRIANLKSGCTDGLLLLSSTACIVARDSHASIVDPPAKRMRA